MIGILLAAALQAVSPNAEVESAADTASTLAELERIYADSCINRAYGSFDDVCDAMGRQIGAYRKQLAREQGRRIKPSAPAHPAVGSEPPAAAAPASPTAGGAG